MYIDRVVDELNPERHFTANDILSLLSPMVCGTHISICFCFNTWKTPASDGFLCFQGNQAPPTDLSSHANEYLFDPVMMQILRKYGTWLTKVILYLSLVISCTDSLV